MTGELSPLGRDDEPAPPDQLRASHEDRVVELLRVAAGDGRLTAEELDERLEVALTARTYGQLTALVKDLLTPLIAAIVGQPDFSAMAFAVNGSKFLVGDFINALVSFLLIAAAVYFFVIVPVNTLMARLRRGEAPPDPTTKKCPECLSDVPIAARRCAFCTSALS